jgi:hypothetical protein
MQYKIPVQIENEDTIFLGLSIRQLVILMTGAGLGYSTFKKLEPAVGTEAALIPALLFAGLGAVIALFKNSEMTFLPFLLNLIRLQLNVGTRVWQKGADSHSTFVDVGYVTSYANAKNKIENKNSTEAFETVENQLSKI